ncbi:FAD-dependent oxidoreductase [Demequina sp. SO4-18]|uniref:FAD-dependent oxidoreductase n=1 Tax=Demequina sp. SO4-18 TaxID=3401026 RepID=UPI003B5C33F5
MTALDSTTAQGLPVVIIGAGPVGLAAAAHAIERGLDPIVLESGRHAGSSVREWAHISLFSPWRFDTDAAARRLLARHGWDEPAGDEVPTGGDLVERYLQPLSEVPELAGRIRYGARVLSVSRAGIDKTRSIGREQHPFVVRVQTAVGVEDVFARAVIDASGTWHTPSPLGAMGIPAAGESEASEWLVGGLPDVLGEDRARFAGKRTLVVGLGHSAANTLLALVDLAHEAPGTEIVWAIRGDSPQRLYGAGAADELPERGALGTRLESAVEAGDIRLLRRFEVASLTTAPGGRVAVTATGPEGDQTVTVDAVAAATGFRPDLDMTRELQLDLDSTTESPSRLAPLIDPNFHSCGTVEPHGADVLAHPEKDFYVVGMKSYGRAPTFLLATGYEQVRSVVAAIAGDHEAAGRVELALPETGVCCSTPGASQPALTSGFATGMAHGRSGEGQDAPVAIPAAATLLQVREVTASQDACCS